MRRVTNEDIIIINSLYYKYKSMAEVARQTGWSAGTVSKYVDKNYQPVAVENIKHFAMVDLPEFDPSPFDGVDNFGDLCVMSMEEEEEIKELWKELAI